MTDEQRHEQKKARDRAWYQAHKDEHNARGRLWHKANLEKHRAQNRDWGARNKEKVKERTQRWRQEHAEKERERLRIWAQEHPEQMRERWKRYAQSHKKEMRAKHRAWRARKRGAVVRNFTASEWVVMQVHYDHRCVYCGKRRKGKLTQDHLTPLSQGGAHTLSNIVPACRTCNSRKGARAVLIPVQPMLI